MTAVIPIDLQRAADPPPMVSMRWEVNDGLRRERTLTIEAGLFRSPVTMVEQ
jgi:hypothetical protein